MKTKTQHIPYLQYAKMIVEKCNKITQKNIVLDVEITDTNRGWAYGKSLKITIPVWAINTGFEHFTQYVIHEYSHHCVGLKHGHDEVFKNQEMDLCKKLINVKLIYSRAYVKKIIRIKDNTIAYEKGKTVKTGINHVWICSCGHKYQLTEKQHLKVLKYRFPHHCKDSKLEYVGIG